MFDNVGFGRYLLCFVLVFIAKLVGFNGVTKHKKLQVPEGSHTVGWKEVKTVLCRFNRRLCKGYRIAM